ncbi:hypothetical protein V5P93_000890 [Actinokineospora auranticolor]|uniref:Uncharacterized protein n=1 Tax=Actinokineospora auranticolor TaxID=155976 RepID=A0A2S6GYB7_9PSEU|nr:hypothetical protein [Actinokineospora auranticolor]PPK70232.1 hypothetical protein CLV40_102143 [Actinokineospora auranticolor]
MDSGKNLRQMIRLYTAMTVVAAISIVLMLTIGTRLLALIVLVVLVALGIPTVRAALRAIRDFHATQAEPTDSTEGAAIPGQSRRKRAVVLGALVLTGMSAGAITAFLGAPRGVAIGVVAVLAAITSGVILRKGWLNNSC